MNLQNLIKIDDSVVDLDTISSALNKKYICESCDIDTLLQFSLEDLFVTVTRIPSKKNNLEIAFWGKCPICKQDILIKRVE